MRKTNRSLILMLSLVLTGLMLCPCVLADQVVLKNGDRLTGTILESDDEVLILKSELVGEIEMKWTAIAQVSSSEPVYVTLQDQRVLVGKIANLNGALDVQSREAGTVTVARSMVRSVRSEDEERAYRARMDRWDHPRLLDFWSGSADVGLSLTRGNSSTSTLDVSAGAVRPTRNDKTSLYFTTLFSEEGISTGKSETTARSIRGGGRYDHNVLTDWLFTFGFADFESDRFQLLDLRSVLGGGLGGHALKTERTVLDIYGGADFNQELFSERVERRVRPNARRPRLADEFFTTHLTRRSGELVLGEDLFHSLRRNVSLTERLVFFPNLSQTGEYRLNFDASLITKINKWLDWQVSFSDRYISNPIVRGIKKNDILLTAGIRITFGEGDASYGGMGISGPSIASSQLKLDGDGSSRPSTSRSARQRIVPRGRKR